MFGFLEHGWRCMVSIRRKMLDGTSMTDGTVRGTEKKTLVILCAVRACVLPCPQGASLYYYILARALLGQSYVRLCWEVLCGCGGPPFWGSELSRFR